MRCLPALLLCLLAAPAAAAEGNRLTYLDDPANPYYVSRHFPKLTTPQWVGEDGVEAVVILSIDDMKQSKRYEDFLRPILKKLAKVQGNSPLSIMTCQADPTDEQLQIWLKEGLGLETHTFDHPCPLLQGTFAKGEETYSKCVDLLASVPNNRPRAFRTPCCDSKNTFSPRFLAEIFCKKTAKGNYLDIDSSVFNVLTPNDPALPRDLVMENGQERFRKYCVPGFVNTIDDYPYPYVINRLCWEIPCVTPSDWQAQNVHKENGSPFLLRDWQAALDATVIKQGVMCICFHPYGWSKPQQHVDFIDYAVAKYGKKVKFLNFREAYERLTKNLLAGQPLRAADGSDNGVRLLDVNNDGYIDVVIGNDKLKQTRIWSPGQKKWVTMSFPLELVKNGQPVQERFGILHADGHPSCLVRSDAVTGAWHWNGKEWAKEDWLLAGLEIQGKAVATGDKGRDRGVRLRDLDGDGICELIVGNDAQQGVFAWSAAKETWQKLPFTLPAGATIVNAQGQDNGLRFIDIDEDGRDDVLFSNEDRFSLHLFDSLKTGWSRTVAEGKRGAAGELPMAARKGTNNGLWIHSRGLCVQNENAFAMERVTFNEILAKIEPEARSIAASLRSLKPRPGFQVELLVSEPLVQSPIAFAWAPDGKLWVVEMGDYPLGVDGKGKPGGRVKYLEDTKGTGVYDKATVFLDELPFPTGVLPWRNGVLVTCAPDIFYAEDTKGTGKADRKEILYTGFNKGNQQHRVNSLAWGLDNWIYCANGDSGGVVKSLKTGKTVDIRGRDFRIRPDTGDIDLQLGQTQYGRSRDDWNHWFGNNNSNPMYQFVLGDHYLRRSPLAGPDARIQVSIQPGASPVFPLSRTMPRFNTPQSVNHFTSACSAIVYRDDLFGPYFSNSTFVSEPVHNLVHREVLSQNGCIFTSRRAEDELTSEFLASSDNWFRPTTIQTGPDGALWVADMYRAVIEHPEWIPKNWQQRIDLRAGHEKGRIYRVFPVGTKPRTPLRLDRLNLKDLVAALDSPNGWQRDTVQQMLLWKNDKAAVPFLIKLAKECEKPLGRAHALCTLDGLQGLTAEVLRLALRDPQPGVREQAVRLCENLLQNSPELGDDLLTMTGDTNSQVRLQLACTLGEWPSAKAGKGLGELALKYAGDRFIVGAVLSSINDKNLDETLRSAMANWGTSPPPPTLVESLLRTAGSLKKTRSLALLLDTVASPGQGKFAPWQFQALAGFLDFLDQRGTPLGSLQTDPDMKAPLAKLEALFAQARNLAGDNNAASAERQAALLVLGRGSSHQQEDQKLLAGLLVPQTAPEVQLAAITALGQSADAKVPTLLLRGWKGYSPALRKQALDVLFRRAEFVRATLDAVDSKQIPASDFDAPRRQSLLQHKDPAIRKRAEQIFAGIVNPDRRKVLEAYAAALKLPGDPMRGSLVFAKNCATCHRFGKVGHAVGPDIESVGDKSPASLLAAILDPNRIVEARYLSYTAVTKAGLSFSGVLASESGNSITLLGPEAKQQVFSRTDLEEFFTAGKSPMPEGLEREIDRQSMADLIAHLRSIQKP